MPLPSQRGRSSRAGGSRRLTWNKGSQHLDLGREMVPQGDGELGWEAQGRDKGEAPPATAAPPPVLPGRQPHPRPEAAAAAPSPHSHLSQQGRAAPGTLPLPPPPLTFSSSYKIYAPCGSLLLWVTSPHTPFPPPGASGSSQNFPKKPFPVPFTRPALFSPCPR